MSSENSLIFDNKNLHTGSFVFTYDSSSDTIISGSDDYLLKFLPFNESVVKDSIEKNKKITSILFSDSKIFFSQEEQLYMSLFDNPNEQEYLDTLTSSLRQILFSKKFNYVICYDGDDNIHIVNLDNNKIFQYKSTNNCIIKFGIVSKDEEFLILCGVDGNITIYNFVKDSSENTAIKFYKKFNAFAKTTIDNFNQTNSIDINSNHDIIISGDLLLKKVNLLDNNTKIESITEFFHKENINFCKFITDDIVLTLDTNNMIKIWDYSSKKLINKYENKNLNNSQPITYLEIVSKGNSKYHILFSDESGAINISEEFMIEIKREKEEDYEKLINEMIENENKEEKKEETEKEEENNKLDEKAPSLSDMEDSEGNLLNKEEIQYNVQEKKENEEHEKLSSLLNNIDLNILKEKLNITDIQEPFISGSTNDLENLNIKYLLFNLTGMVISKYQNSIKTIDVKFSDTSNKKNISFIDGKDYCIVAMNETGIVFGNKVEELNIDEYEKENRRKNGSIEFKSIRISNDNLLNDWIFDLPEEESVILLCIGNDFIGVYTSMSYLRIFSIFGNEKMILSINNNVIALTAFENYLTYAYTSSLPFSNNQQIRFKILDSNNYFNSIFEGEIPISPDSNLIYFSYSAEGILISYDSYNILRGFFYEIENNWIPLIDLGEKYNGKNINFWCVGVEENEVYGLEIKGDRIEPNVTNNPIQKTWNLINDSENDDFYLKSYLFIKFYEKRYLKYNVIKNLRFINFPEYPYTDTMKDLDDIKKMKTEHNKKILNKINEYIIKGENSKVIILYDYLMTNKSKSTAIKLCNEYKKVALSSYLQYKLNLNEIVKEQFMNEGGKVIQYITDNNKLNEKKKNIEKKNDNGMNELASIAIDLKEYQNSINNSNVEIKTEKNNENEEKSEEINTDKVNNDSHIIHEIIQNKNFKIDKNNNKNLENGLDLFNELSKFQKSPTKDQLLKSTIKNNINNNIPGKRKNKDIQNTILPFENKKIKITK